MFCTDFDGGQWAVTFTPADGVTTLDGGGTVTLRDTGTCFVTLPIAVLLDAAAEYVRTKRLDQVRRAGTAELLGAPLLE